MMLRPFFLTVLLATCILYADVTAELDCMSHALSLAGVSNRNAITYSRMMASYQITSTIQLLKNAADLTLRSLGVSEEDRELISRCTSASLTPGLLTRNSTSCDLSDVCTGRGLCEIKENVNSNSQHYACNCQPDFSGDNCENVIDNCLSSPCYPGGNCLNHKGRFTCHCMSGYTGEHCQEKWLTQNNARSRLQQLSSDIKDSVKSYKSNLAVLIENQTKELRILLSSVAGLEQQRLPRYRAFTDEVTWQEASRRCATFGGGLAMVKTPEEQQEVHDIASHYQLSRFWLGASDQTIEGHWLWWDGTRLDYRNFSQRQPNNLGGNEDCLEMWISFRNGRGVWNDNPCFVLHPFLCQFW